MPGHQLRVAARGFSPGSNVDVLRRQLLDAREARAATIGRVAAAMPAGRALIFLSLNVPGPDKNSPRLERVFERAREALAHDRSRSRADGANPAEAGFHVTPPREEGRDALGPWLAVAAAGEPADVKRLCVSLEDALPAGRLIDLDVYDRFGRQIDRASLGLPPRSCLVCPEPAIDCMRAGRHGSEALAEAVRRLLHADDLARLAEALVEAARVELALTPKPGLVDRRDNGSHPDLSFELMERSIALLPRYYAELMCQAGLKPCSTDVQSCQGGRPSGRWGRPSGRWGRPSGLPQLTAAIEAGRRAEERMLAAIGTNAHRGYIFLSGLVLLAFSTCTDAGHMRPGTAADDSRPGTAAATLSRAIADVARRLSGLGTSGVARGHGEAARTQFGVGGILGEALAGLPSIFEHALPALERAEARFGPGEAARHAAMATLMTVVEDTTTLHRCGAEGLARLRHDGRRILDAMENGENFVEFLERLNDEYRAAGMTMGGVADCLAITIGLRLAASG